MLTHTYLKNEKIRHHVIVLRHPQFFIEKESDTNLNPENITPQKQ